MPQNSNFRLLRGHWFFAKNGSYGYGANYGGDPLGSILGPMGSHWVQEMGQNRKKITMPKNSNFRLRRGHRFFAKNGSYGFGAKSRWKHPTVHLGANGVPLGKKNGSKTVKNYHAPKFEFSTTPRSLIFRKKWKLRLWRKLQWWPPRVHLGANGVPLGPRNGSKP